MRKNEIFCMFDDYKKAGGFLLEIVKQMRDAGAQIEKVDKRNMCIECGNWRVICTSVNSSWIGVFKDKVMYFYDGTCYFWSHEIVDEEIKYRFPPWAKEIQDRHILIKILTGELR